MQKTQEKVEKREKKRIFLNLKKFFVKAGNASLNLLYPQNMKCMFCGKDIPDFEKQPFCDDCKKQEIFNNGHRCKFCENPLHDESDVCENCKNNHNLFQKAFCPFLYNNLTRSPILKFKNDYGKYLTPTFAKYIVDDIKKANITIDLIIPVPLHKKKRKARGYNQAEVLANQLGKELNVPVDTTSILKIKQTKQQKKLDYKQRQSNLFSTFLLTTKTNIKDKNILIVDDIMTTCATVNAISALIKKYVNNIYVATIARRDLKDAKPKV